jgi:hypothetical protein
VTVVATYTARRVDIVRESCYRWYKPSSTELSYGCSQEVQ